LPVTTYIYQNIGRVQNRGWEFEASANVWRFNLRGSYSAIDSRIRQVNASYIGSYEVGDKLRNIASTTTGLSISYAFMHTTATLDINHLGASLGTNQAFADQRSKARLFPVSASASPVAFPPFTRYNLNATQDVTPHVALFTSILNAFNNTTGDWTNNTDVIGRRATVGLRLRF
jgi:outer membrane receptor protein involved in Fe transport